jgi:enterochelin esterase-like enzyme
VRIDGLPTVFLSLAGALAVTALLAYTWDRRRIAGRAVLMLAVLLTVTGTAALQLNRLTETYPSWASLVAGSTDDPSPGEPDQSGAGGGSGRPGTAVVDAGGRLIRLRVAGAASGLAMPLTVYLPAAYSAAGGRSMRFPVIEALHGYPGTPASWFRRLDVKRRLDDEIAAGRMAPTVVIFPYQTPDRMLDTECTDLARGPRTETYLTVDVPRWARDHLRIRTDRDGWGLIGYSAGGFCAMNLALRHPDRYAAGASLSGYPEPGIKVGDGSEETTNNVAWRLTHCPVPPVALYLAWAADDAGARKGSQRVVRLARPPLVVTASAVPRGGHSHAVWQRMEGPAFDWLSAHLARAELAP